MMKNKKTISVKKMLVVSLCRMDCITYQRHCNVAQLRAKNPVNV